MQLGIKYGMAVVLAVLMMMTMAKGTGMGSTDGSMSTDHDVMNTTDPNMVTEQSAGATDLQGSLIMAFSAIAYLLLK